MLALFGLPFLEHVFDTYNEASPLAGPELVRRKVRLLQVMAGRFDKSPEAEKFAEWNVKKDVPAAKRVFADWPTPIEASGWEIGHAILIPARCIERDFAWSERNPASPVFKSTANQLAPWAQSPSNQARNAAI